MISRCQGFPLRTRMVLWSISLSCVLITGCVHRYFTVTTNPPGAIVQVNGKTIGPTPIDIPFDYYGTYRLTLLRDGYQTMVIDQPVPTPWYEYFPLEFVSEHLVPWTIRDHRRFHFDLQPLQLIKPEAVLDRSEQLRGRGRTIGEPEAASLVVPVQRIPAQPEGELLPLPSELPPGHDAKQGVPPPLPMPPGPSQPGNGSNQ